MKALVVNALGGRFEPDDVEIAAPIGREVLVDVQASGLCHTDVLFATNNIIPMPAVLGHEVAGIVAEDDLVSKRISLREVNDGYAALQDGSLNRVVVTSF